MQNMQNYDLAYSTPESRGVPSEAIIDLLEDFEQKKLIMHSFLLIRDGYVIAEGYWPFFSVDKKHRMYSVSKSFTSVAIGMMIDEGKISLNDKAADFFPEYLPENPDPHILEATIRDLLMMSAFNTWTSYGREDKDWVKTFFQDKGVKHKPGTIFNYDTAITVTLCGIVEKISGKPMLEYMRPVFDEIGISKDIICIKSPDGRSWTGSGILCTTRDLGRFALFCMNKGEWNGKQLISRKYMEDAVSCQINSGITRNDSELQYGYGYQFWCLRDGAFACNGMGSQLALCSPKHGLILITTADNQALNNGTDNIISAYFKLIEKINVDTLTDNESAQTALKHKISSLAIPLPQGGKTTKNAALYSGKRYIMQENEMGLKWLSVDIDDEKCVFNYENNTGSHSLTFGMGKYVWQKFPEKYYGMTIGTKDMFYDSVGAGAWENDDTLLCTLYAIDIHVGTLKMQLDFSQDGLSVYMSSAAEWFFDEYNGFATGYLDSGI